MEGLFTFSFEIDALCDLKQYAIAWRQLRSREEIIFGEKFDLERHEWKGAGIAELEWAYAPLLFFNGRYRLGCSMLEAALELWFVGDKLQSYDLLFHVYNGDKVPTHRCRVTLAHFYDRLGKSLLEWRHWEEFVNGFHPKLLRMGGVRREELLADANRLPGLFAKLLAIRNERTPTRIGGSQSDLTDSAGMVRKRQDAIRKKLKASEKRARARHDLFDAKLKQLFPELRELLK